MPCEDPEKTGVDEPGNRSSPDTKSAVSLSLDLPVSRTVGNKCSLLKSHPAYESFVLAPQTKTKLNKCFMKNPYKTMWKWLLVQQKKMGEKRWCTKEEIQTVIKHVKRHSASFVVQETQTRTTQCIFTTRAAIKLTIIPNACEHLEKWEFSHTVGRDLNCYACLRKPLGIIC